MSFSHKPPVTFLLNLSVTLPKEFPHLLSYSVNRSLICINSMFGCNIQFSLTQCTTNEIKEAFKRIVWYSFLFRQVIRWTEVFLLLCRYRTSMISKSKQYSSDGRGTKLDINFVVCLFVLLWVLTLFFCISFCQGT